MKILFLLLFISESECAASEPDVPPREEKPVRVPAAILTPAEETRREALTRFGLGFYRTRDDRLADAMQQFQVALQNDPKAVAPQRELVAVYAELGRDAAAIRAAREVLARDPDDAETAQRLGRILMDGKKYRDAAKAFLGAAKSPRGRDEIPARLVLLKELAAAAEKAGDFPAREYAAREQLAVLAANKAALLKPDLFTAQEFDRRRAHAHEDLGAALVGLGKFDTASAAFETARDLYADPKGAHDPAGTARLYWNLSESLAAQGEPAKALKELDLYLEQRPTGFAPYERWVKLMAEAERTRDIPGTLTRLAQLNPGNPAPAWLAAAATLEVDPDAGDAAFAKLLDRADRPEYFRVLVQAYQSADQAKKWLDIADRLFTASRPKGFFDPPKPGAKDPPAPMPTPKAADVQRARFFNEAAKATKGFSKSLIRQMDADTRAGVLRFPDTLELVMALAARDGQLNAFAPALKAMIGRKTEFTPLWMLIVCLRHQRNWEEIAATAEALSVADNGRFYPSIAIQAAVAHAELGHEAPALALVEKLDGRIYIRVKKAEIYNILGKHKQALREIDEVLDKESPKGADLRMLLLAQIGTLHLLKENAKAETILREMLDHDPDDVVILNNYGYHLAEQGRKFDEAEAMIRRAIELDRDEKTKSGDPDAESGNYLDSLGWLQFKRGRFAEARKSLEAATRFVEVSENGVVWDHLGDTYLRLDENKLAAAAYEKAIQIYARSHEGRQDGRIDDAKRKLKLVK